MGKKGKKKAGSSLKEKRGPPVSVPQTTSPNTVSQPSIPSVETIGDESSAVKEKKVVCPHFDKGIDLVKVSAKIRPSEPFKCEDCREGAADRRASKGGKGKHGKKKSGGSAVSKSDSKALWICLECGHVSCGGAGLPTTAQSHAVRHSRQARHPLAMQIENPNLRWCFPCSRLIPVLTPSENGEQKDSLSEIVKLLKAPPPSGPSLDVEDVWFTSGSITSEIKSENTTSRILEGRGRYVVRGLSNLGNTCFFNSVLQNLLAIDKLRDYFSSTDGPMGPLTVSLKKFFSETSPASGMRNVISPRSLFGCLCSKAPQFRGYQQHDSHELLRCLLDGLCTEESTSARKQVISLKEAGNAPTPAPTFVDTIFGGQLSSTVSCLECGHASIVYEPFLDLSLPLPTKRSPSKKAQAVSRAKKPKLPPRRCGRFRPKINMDSDSSPANSTSNISTGGNASQIQSIEPVAEKLGSPASDSSRLVPDTNGDSNGSAPQSLSDCQGNENKPVVDNTVEEAGIPSDCSAGLDCIKPDFVSNGHEAASQLIDNSVGQANGKGDALADVSLQLPVEPSMQADSCPMKEPSPLPDDSSWMDYIGGPDDYDMASQIDDESPAQESGNRNEAIENSDVLNHKSKLNNDMDHFGNSWEDESPVQVQASEVLLLPYKEDTSTKVDNEVILSSAGGEQGSLDFGGFGDLFDEPEVSGPALNPLSNTSETNGVAEIADVESDPDEVDNTDSPVSVESCLAYFMKPELLSKIEHGWQCEQCSKALVEQRMRQKKELQKPASRVVSNGAENNNPNAPSESDKDCSPSTAVPNGSNRSMEKCIASGMLEGKNEKNCGLPEVSESSCSYKTCYGKSFSGPTGDSSSVPDYTECKFDEVGHQESELLGRPHELEESDDEEIDSWRLKVTRDATKRILINKAPPILTIHLKRFSQDARGRLSKLNGHVNFRETIDFRPYINPSCIVPDKHKYRLVGVVEHLGTMRGGHYVAYVRGGAKNIGNGDSVWYYASDGCVRETCLEEVLRCEAYMLFYEEI